MVSHELRTPLTSIKGFATTLLATDVVWDAESQHDFLVTINEEADKLTDLIEQLLDLSRLQAGKLRIHPEPRSIADILDMSMAQFEALARQHQLIIHIPADLPPVMADAQRISQVLVNLVENAVKYAPEGTQIIITGEAQPSTVRIDVQDEGPGIPVGDRERIFEPFRQSETAIAQQSKGIGLGLAICKGLIETHGGKIWVADGAEAGTTMSFSLPLASLQQI
jgi:signal transduction histidine kinase